MPPYWRRRRYPRRYKRFRWRRPRKTFFRTRRWRRRRRYGVRRKFKLSSIKIRQFQPKQIRKCHIKGFKCLFQGSSLRADNNYWQYPRSIVPEGQPGGGGWGLLALSLSSFYEDWQYLQNIFTASNAGLPLVRIIGFKLTFYQEDYVDYVVEIDNCWPMLDTPLKHPNCQPSRMLLSKKKIIMPSTQTRPLRKRKKTVWVRPPSQLENRWYFQKDICNTKLIMIAATACSLNHYYIAPRAQSNNATLWCLNTNIFKNADFQHFGTNGYQPKNNTYIYTNTNTNPDQFSKEKLIPLTDPKTYTAGATNTDPSNATKGNPFYKTYLLGTAPTYTSTKSPQELSTMSSDQIKQEMTPTHWGLAIKLRYNPDKDNGSTNKAYFVDNYRTAGDRGFEPPTDPNRIIEGFPLWLLLWGWPDWIKKLAEIHRVDKDYILVIQTDQFTEKFPYYVLLDDTFVNGKGAYETPQTTEDLLNWYPKFLYQHASVTNICKTGPGVTRTNMLHSVEAKMKYDLTVKWGGCPSTLEKVYDPCSQPKWPTPYNFTEGLQIQNPANDPRDIIHTWDVRRDFITAKAIKRLKKDKKTDDCTFSTTDHRSGVPAIGYTTQSPETSETETETSEEETSSLQSKLNQLRRNNRKLHKQLLKLIQTTK